MLYIDTYILTFESEVILIYLNTYMQILVDDEICCVIAEGIDVVQCQEKVVSSRTSHVTLLEC